MVILFFSGGRQRRQDTRENTASRNVKKPHEFCTGLRGKERQPAAEPLAPPHIRLRLSVGRAG